MGKLLAVKSCSSEMHLAANVQNVLAQQSVNCHDTDHAN